MKSVPLTVPPEVFEEVIRSQSAYSKELAEKVATGANLTKLDREYIAAVLRRHAAKVLIAKQPRKPGQPPKIDAGSVALLFAALTESGRMRPNAAYEKLAGQHAVSVQTIKNAVKKHGEASIRVMRALGFRRQESINSE
jgi:precorrin-6x reductase